MAETTNNSIDGARAKLVVVGALLAVIGLALSLYTVYHHIELKTSGITDFACNINDKFSCDKIAGSQYSEVFGQPLGVLGAGYFLGMLILLGLAWSKDQNRKETLQTYAVLSWAGVAVSVLLGGISAFALGYGCIACIAVYAVSVLQALNVWMFKNAIPKNYTIKNIFNGGTIALIGVIIAVIGYNFARPKVSEIATQTASRQNNLPVMDLLPNVNEITINRSDYSGMGQDYRKGNDSAKVVIVEFADFECPACAHASATLKEVSEELGDKVLIVFKNYPLSNTCNSEMQSNMHKHACRTAIMARCAGQFGKFWEFHDMAFDNQKNISESETTKWARAVGLTDAQIKECEANPAMVAKIKDDAQLGTRLQIDSTPTIFINGRKFIGSRSKDAIKNQVLMLLNE